MEKRPSDKRQNPFERLRGFLSGAIEFEPPQAEQAYPIGVYTGPAAPAEWGIRPLRTLRYGETEPEAYENPEDPETFSDHDFISYLADYGIDPDLIGAALARPQGQRMNLVRQVLMEHDPDVMEYVGPPQPTA